MTCTKASTPSVAKGLRLRFLRPRPGLGWTRAPALIISAAAGPRFNFANYANKFINLRRSAEPQKEETHHRVTNRISGLAANRRSLGPRRTAHTGRPQKLGAISVGRAARVMCGKFGKIDHGIPVKPSPWSRRRSLPSAAPASEAAESGALGTVRPPQPALLDRAMPISSRQPARCCGAGRSLHRSDSCRPACSSATASR